MYTSIRQVLRPACCPKLVQLGSPGSAVAEHLFGDHMQGAQLMSKFGINVPDGMPAFTMDDVAKAADAMKDENNEVCSFTLCWKIEVDDIDQHAGLDIKISPSYSVVHCSFRRSLS